MSLEERVAATVADRFGLVPPVDVEALAQRFADVELDHIPGACDGLVLGMQGQRSRPLILLKKGAYPPRQRFTLAHELGHILVPGHIGSAYLCDPSHTLLSPHSYEQWDAERQANRFAARILIPTAWLQDLVRRFGGDEIGQLLAAVRQSDVSSHVACLRLLDVLPAGHVFAILGPDDHVALSGKTRGTGAEAPKQDEPLDRRLLDQFAMGSEEFNYGSRRVVWWNFRTSQPLDDPGADPRETRGILEDLIARHATDASEAKYLRSSLNGVIGSENGTAQREGDVRAGVLYARFRARFARARDEYPADLVNDADLELWLRRKASELGQ